MLEDINPSTCSTVFNYGKNGKPTNGEFIALVADKLIMEAQAREKAV